MGLFGSRPTAEIHLDPIEKPFYWAGETVSGTVVLENKKQISVGYVNVQCIGELFYQRTERRGAGRDSQTVVVDEHLPFFASRKDLVGSVVNSIANNVSHSFFILFPFL